MSNRDSELIYEYRRNEYVKEADNFETLQLSLSHQSHEQSNNQASMQIKWSTNAQQPFALSLTYTYTRSEVQEDLVLIQTFKCVRYLAITGQRPILLRQAVFEQGRVNLSWYYWSD